MHACLVVGASRKKKNTGTLHYLACDLELPRKSASVAPHRSPGAAKHHSSSLVRASVRETRSLVVQACVSWVLASRSRGAGARAARLLRACDGAAHALEEEACKRNVSSGPARIFKESKTGEA
jgi:hypothetical protein